MSGKKIIEGLEAALAMNPDDLRAIAEEATPGPWTADKGADGGENAKLIVFGPRGENVCVVPWFGHGMGIPRYANAAHIAAFNPSTCLALLDELDGLRARVESAEKALRPLATCAKTLEIPAIDGFPFDDPREVLWAGECGRMTVADFRAASAHFTNHPEGKI